MEDAATAEICRAQIWQWTKHGAKLDDGRLITRTLVRSVLSEELDKLQKQFGNTCSAELETAGRIMEDLAVGEDFPEFLTLVAYEYLK